jgi:hypothetical protein
MALAQECTDSDGGKNLYVKGFVETSNEYYTDYCTYNYQLYEGSCSADSKLVIGHHGCSNGCYNGACIDEDKNILFEGKKTIYALNGIDYDITADFVGFDSVRFTINGEITSPIGEADSYTISDGKLEISVIEIISEQVAGGVRYVEFALSVGKEEVKCTDSDGGVNYEVRGRTGTTCGGAEGAGCVEDICETSKLLTEYYCEGKDIASKSYECPNFCDGGKGACEPFTVFPDVAIYGIDLSSSFLSVGENLKITVSITNYGGGVGHYPFMLEYGDRSKKFITGEFPPDNQEPKKILAGTAIAPDKIQTNSYQHVYKKPGLFTIKAKIAAFTDTNNANNVLTKTVSVCEDSDDGKNYFVKGKTIAPDLSTKKLVSKEDKCVTEGADAGNLLEYYCSLGQTTFESFDCPYGCEDGVCLSFYEEEELIEVLETKEEEEIESSIECPQRTCKVVSVECIGTNILVVEECKIYIQKDNGCEEIITSKSRINKNACEEEESEELIECQGCQLNQDTCVPFGTRIEKDNIGYYCSIERKMLQQNEDSISCQNTYECVSNNCKGSVCTPICSGCLDEKNVCIPFGTRTKTQYCDIDYSFQDQKLEDVNCNNNYECSTNVCVNNQCISPNLIQKIIMWFQKLFG